MRWSPREQEGCSFKDTPDDSLSLSAVWGYNENTAIHQPSSRSSQHRICGCLILEFPVSRTVRYKRLLFLSTVYAVLQQPRQSKQLIPLPVHGFPCQSSNPFLSWPLHLPNTLMGHLPCPALQLWFFLFPWMQINVHSMPSLSDTFPPYYPVYFLCSTGI